MTLHNVFRVTSRVLSGSQPEGDAAFAWLAKQGVKTVLSVDGARPDVESARRHGLQYVHLPIGYDGVSSNRTVELTKLASTIPGPFYVHCHHGKHRGPAAAAILCEAADQWSPVQAEDFLKAAGTSPEYPGLFRSVKDYRRPADEILALITYSFPEVAPSSGFVAAMVAIDSHLDRLRTCQQNGWNRSPTHPDVTPPHEALILFEQLRELGRENAIADRGSEFQKMLLATQQAAEDLRRMLADSGEGSGQVEVRDLSFRRLTESCSACHKKYRN